VAVDHHQRTGRLLVGLIDQHTSATAAAMPWDGPFRRSLEQASYVQSIAWIGACLAEALHYAHARRLVHMDIKPSNVLITSDGQPMLLDFHLARAPLLRGGFVTDRLGGTPGWMSPEQEAAFDAVLSLQPLPADVDGRSDIYALGRLLAQALGREVRNRRGRLKVDYGARLSAGMIDIIEKCLAIDPRDRFADASQLADDLRRELSDQPLRGVRNRSVRERLRKWRRRNPAALAWAVAAAVGVIAFLGGAASLAALHQQRVAQIQTALDDGRRALILGEYDEALDVLTRAWGASGRVPFVGEQRAALRQDILRAERGRLAVELHAVADRIRFQHADELPTGAAASALSRLCETIWLRRERLLGEPAGGFDERVRTDLLEVAVVWADLCSGPIPNTGLRVPSPEAMRILDEAEASYGPSFAIDLRRSALNATDLFEPLRRPSSSWQHYDLGRALLRAGRPETAIVEFESALQSEPQDFWSQFYQGLCAFRLKRFDEAAAAFRTCVALKPQSSICHYNRAMAEESLGRDEQAEREYTQCLKLDSKRAEAYLNRGILSHKHNRIDDAISDYDKGLFVTSTAETRGLLHYNLARAMRDKGAFPEALKHAEEALRLGCEPARALRKELR
jgi:tetratricopeptide (TPR) repeat protein